MLTPEIGFASTVESIGSPIFLLRNDPTDALVSLVAKPEGSPRGAYSHDTALSLHELSDMMPVEASHDVPRDFAATVKFRRSSLFTTRQSTPSDVQGNARGTCDHVAANDRGSAAERTRGPKPAEASRRRSDSARSHWKEEIDRMPHDKLQRSLRELAGQPA